MSKAVLISIRPKWVEKIVNGEKTIEVRKTRPKLETPFKCYIYCTLPKYPHEDFIATNYPMPQFYGGGKVVGEFTCERIAPITYDGGRLYFLNKDWYDVLVNTGFGKGILAVCLLVLLISFAAVIRLTKPVEYKR